MSSPPATSTPPPPGFHPINTNKKTIPGLYHVLGLSPTGTYTEAQIKKAARAVWLLNHSDKHPAGLVEAERVRREAHFRASLEGLFSLVCCGMNSREMTNSYAAPNVLSDPESLYIYSNIACRICDKFTFDAAGFADVVVGSFESFTNSISEEAGRVRVEYSLFCEGCHREHPVADILERAEDMVDQHMAPYPPAQCPCGVELMGAVCRPCYVARTIKSAHELKKTKAFLDGYHAFRRASKAMELHNTPEYYLVKLHQTHCSGNYAFRSENYDDACTAYLSATYWGELLRDVIGNPVDSDLFASLYYNTALSYFRLGNLDRAMSFCRLALKTNPRYPKPLITIINICQQLGTDDAKEEGYQALVSLRELEPLGLAHKQLFDQWYVLE